MTAVIHSTALVSESAKLGERVHIGPFCTVGPHVRIEAGTRLVSHVAIDGHTTIGAGNTFYPFASIGLPPQDKKYGGEQTRLTIGNNNTIRESVTINTGTVQDKGITQIGDNNLLMALVHVAHDCTIGNNCVLANSATLAGHVVMEDFAVVGGLTGVHQFVRIGCHAMIGGHSAVDRDVLPYATVAGERARLTGLNLTGLRRREFPRETIRALQQAFSQLFDEEGENSLEVRASNLKKDAQVNEVKELSVFVETSERGLIPPSADSRLRRESADA